MNTRNENQPTWQHDFGNEDDPPTETKKKRSGVGIARLGTDGKWTVRFQSNREALIVPLAWSPRGDALLCARVHNDTGRPLSQATVFLADESLRPTRVLFRLDASTWQGSPRDFGRLADWAVIPAGVRLLDAETTAPR